MGLLFKLLKIVAVIIALYIAISFFHNTPSSNKVRSEYIQIKGTLEQIDISNIDFTVLESQGSSSLNSIGAVITEVWDTSCAFAQRLFQKSTPLRDTSVSSSTPSGWPVNKRNVCSIGSYGMRIHPTKMWFIKHKGVDLACAIGAPIYATADGVIEISTQGEAMRGYGQMILIMHNDQYKSRYAHLSRRIVNTGQKVQRGQVIGYVGSSGNSTGPHLHYEVIRGGYAVNPMSYINF